MDEKEGTGRRRWRRWRRWRRRRRRRGGEEEDHKNKVSMKGVGDEGRELQKKGEMDRGKSV